MDIDHCQDKQNLELERKSFDDLDDTNLTKVQFENASSIIQPKLDQVNQHGFPIDSTNTRVVVLQQNASQGDSMYLDSKSPRHKNLAERSALLGGVNVGCHDKLSKRPSAVPLSRQESHKRFRNTPQKWSEHRSRIQSLYIDQGKSLTETMRVLAEEHGFRAS